MNKLDPDNVIPVIMFVLMLMVIATALFFSIYAWVLYGNKPIAEIPAWALWFMWGTK